MAAQQFDFNTDQPIPSKPTNTGTPDVPINLPSHATGLPVWQSMDFSDLDTSSAANMSADDMYAAIPKEDRTFDSVQGAILPALGRYKTVFPGRDYEEMHAQQQDKLDKWVNGTTKALGTTASSFIGGTLGLVYGAGKAYADQRFSSMFDNEVNRYFDDLNKKMEDALPNYYTHAEQDSRWYSTDNIWTANFWSDKVIKNLGYSAGSMLGGGLWGKALKGIFGINKLVRMGKGLELAKGVDDAIASTTRLSRFGAVSEAIGSMGAKTLNQAGKIISNSERGIVSLMGSAGEASMEALGNMNNYRDKMIQNYIDRNGYPPTGDDLLEINNHAEKIGNFTWGMNVALLTATNYMMLPKIFNSSKAAEKRAMNEVIKEGAEEGLQGLEKTMARVDAAYVSKPFILERIAGKKIGGAFDKYLVKPGALLFSRMEAFEEGMQFAIESGTEDYFKRAEENNEDIADFWDNFTGTMGNIFTEGVHKALTTKEGLESILIGGISGGLQGSFSPFGDSKLRERGITGRGGYKGKNTDAAIQELGKGTLTKALKDAKKYFSIGINSQQLRQAAIADNNTLAEKDYERDYVQAYIMPRIKYGKLEAIKEEISLYREQAMASDKAFEAMQDEGIVLENETRDQFLGRLSSLENTAVQMDKIYNTISDNYSATMTPDGKRVYPDDVVDMLAYASGKVLDYDTRLRDLNSSLLARDVKTLPIEEAIKASEGWKTGDVNKIVNDKDVKQATLDALAAIESQEVDPNKDKKDIKKDLVDFASMLVKRKAFATEYENMKAKPEEYTREEKIDVTDPTGALKRDPTKPRESIIIKTKKGDKQVFIGEMYMQGRITEKSAKDHDVYSAPIIVVLGKNADGTYKIKTASGKIVDKTAQELEEDSLSLVEDLKQNKKVAFYIANWNTIYKHRGARVNGKAAMGRIHYDKELDRIMFVYKNHKGQLVQKEVINTDLSMKEAIAQGYKQPKMTPEGVLTPKQQAATDAFVAQKTSISEKLRVRNSIMVDLYNTSKERLDKVVKDLENAKQKLASETAKLEQQIKEEAVTKTGEVRKRTTKLFRDLTKTLATLRETLTNDIEELEAEREELEATIPQFKVFLDDLGSAPESGFEMIKQLKGDIKDLGELVEATKDAIKQTKSMLEHVNELLVNALGVLNTYIKDLKAKNPNIPLFVDDLIDRIEKYLGPEGAQKYVDDRLGLTEQVVELESDINNFKAEINVPALEKRAGVLTADLQELEKSLAELLAMQKAKEVILNEFKEYAVREAETKKEEKKLQSNPDFYKLLVGTLNKIAQNFFGGRDYEAEAKKPNVAVVSSTRAIDDGKPHQARANHFGARLDKMPDRKRKNIKGIIVTQKTQAGVIDGLVEHLLSMVEDAEERAKYPADEFIVMVMVETDRKGNKFLVDQDGKRIPAGADVLNTAIYQVFPTKKLQGTYRDANGKKVLGSMFRDDTPKNVVDSLTAQYEEWVDKQLALDKHEAAYDITASFGFPDFVKYMGETKEEIDHNARTSAKAAGLITDKDLEIGPVVSVKMSSNPFTVGNTTFKDPKGRVFLVLKNGVAKLFNKNFSEDEAIVIYDVMHQVSKNLLNNGGKSDPETEVLFDWLRSTVYWGFAKDRKGKEKPAGYNNIWFKKVTDEKGEDKVRLFISGKTTDPAQAMEFTPRQLEARRGEILIALQKMYNNTSNHLSNEKWQDQYVEIIGIKPDGTPETREWLNYQTYLLSDTYPDGSERTGDKIPLTTKFRPLVDENDTNRKGIYFSLTSGPKIFEEPEPEIPKEVPEEAPEEDEEVEEEEPGYVTEEGYVFNGTKENTIMLNSGPATFTMDIYKHMLDGAGLSVSAPGSTVDAVMKKFNETEAQAIERITNTVATKLKDTIDQAMSDLQAEQEEGKKGTEGVPEDPKGPPVKVVPTPTVVGGIDFSGNTWNDLTIKFGPIRFKMDAKKFLAGDRSRDAIDVEVDDVILEAIKTAKAAEGYDDQDAIAFVYQNILFLIKDQLALFDIKQNATPPLNNPPVEETVVEEAETQVIPYKGNTYTVDFKTGTVTNNKTKKVVSPTSVVGKAVLNQVDWDKGEENVETPEIKPVYLPDTPDDFNDTPLLKSIASGLKVVYVPRFIQEEAYKNDKQNQGHQSIDRIIERGGYSVEELFNLLPNWRELINKKLAEKAKAPKAPAAVEVQKQIEEVKEEGKTANAAVKTDIANANKVNLEEAGKPDKIDINDPSIGTDESDEFDYRLETLEQANAFETENWKKVEEFIGENFPWIPVYRVMNMIKATNGRQAHGALHKAAIYLSQNAEVGTVYHEVFEAVWKMFAGPKEKEAIIREFRSRPGYFIDREDPLQRRIKYSQATSHQIKEQLAEEFRDKKLYGKDPITYKGKNQGNLIKRLFDDLINWLNTFFTGKEAISNTEKLFSKISSGYYKTYNPYLTKLSFAQAGIIDIADIDVGDSAELRINNIPAMQIHDIIQFMTFKALSPLAESNEILFSLKNVLAKDKGKAYEDLKKQVLSRLKTQALTLSKQGTEKGGFTPGEQRMYENIVQLFDTVQDEWDEIVEKHAEHLKTFGLEFDENDELNLNTEEAEGKSDWQDARTIDSFRKANSAVKLLLGTLPAKRMVNGKPKIILSSIGGPTLLPADAIHIDMQNRLHDAVTPGEMMERLNNIALKEANYHQLFRRLTGQDPSENEYDFADIDESDFRLISAFWRTMKKQNADVVTVFVQPSGEVFVSDSTLANASKESKRSMMGSIIAGMKEETTPYFTYGKDGKYRATDVLKKVTFDKMNSYTKFLEGLGIIIDPIRMETEFMPHEQKKFKEIVAWIQSTIAEIGDKETVVDPETGEQVTLDSAIMTINSTTLDIDTRMSQLGVFKAKLDNPIFESTYFNINGQRTQSYVGPNAPSNFYDVISKVQHFEEDLQEPQNRGYRYLLTDKFAKGSLILKRMFVQEKDGTFSDRISGSEGIMKTTFVDGTVDEYTGKKKESSKLNYAQRFLQEINLNIEGIFLNLVPGDSSIEHANRLHHDDKPFVNTSAYQNKLHLAIFRDYFISEVDLARDDRPVVGDRKTTDLRFFKSILADPKSKTPNALHDMIMYSDESGALTAEELYDDYKKEIDIAVQEYIKQEARDTKELFDRFQIIKSTKEGLVAPGLNFKEEELSGEFLKQKLEVLSTNYIIANIEMHKLIYSDPYQYTDELKRIKNFNSPRQALLFGTPQLNAFLHSFYNKGVDPKDKSAYSDFNRDHFRAINIADILGIGKNIGYSEPTETTDGGGYITIQGARKFKLRVGEWTPANEKQFQHDLGYERLAKSGASKEALKKYERKNPHVKNTYTPIKPIVSGNKENGRDYNDVVLHKFALIPISYRILHQLEENSMAVKLYDKMIDEDIDYAVYASGSKVGTEKVHDIYDRETGQFNDAPFETEAEKHGLMTNDFKRGVSNIPFSIVGLQTEVPSKDTPLVTQGSQITKLVTMDFLEAGVPIDFMPGEEDYMKRFKAWTKLDEKGRMQSELYRKIKHNQELLEEKIIEGYESLLKKLGIEATVNDEGEAVFIIKSRERFMKTLKDEILKREVNDNITASFEGFEDGHVLLEATPSYQQIRNILYSIADKSVVRQKISGGLKVQIPSAMLLDKFKVIVGTFTNEKTGETKPILESEELAFYENEDGKRVCEIMVARWFKSTKTDEELLEYFNEDPEGQKQLAALTGIAFRTPTQKQNSIEVFKIKRFLPEDFGDSVIVPADIVKKTGSDFDIDKLSIYLKSLFEDVDGKIKVIPFYGYGQQAKDKFGAMFDKILTTERHKAISGFANAEYMNDMFRDIATGKATSKDREKWIPKFHDMFSDLADENGVIDAEDVRLEFLYSIQKKGKTLLKLTNEDLQDVQRDLFMDKMYRKSLENEYISSLEDLVSDKHNFDALVRPNSAEDLVKLNNKINELKGIPKTDYTNVGNMLSRKFMSKQRHNFVSGKQGIAIAAIAQTNNAQNQRSPIFTDFRKIYQAGFNELDKTILGGNSNAVTYANNHRINFRNYNAIEVDGVIYPTLSISTAKQTLAEKVAGKAKEFISDTIGMFIDGYVDVAKGAWIMEMGATYNTAGTWLFLLKLGIPRKDVAYFMNQPIIVEYLQLIENKGQTWLFSDRNISEALAMFEPIKAMDKEEVDRIKGDINEIPDADTLEGLIGREPGDMTVEEMYEQQFMLKEFVKYAKLASQLFEVIQGSNHDTANINDPYLVTKKEFQLEAARNTIISSVNEDGETITGVDSIMNNSFVGRLSDFINKYRNAFSTVLLSDRSTVRKVMIDVLKPYMKLNDRDFVKVSQKAVNDLFDWAVQNDRSINNHVVSIMLGDESEESAAKQIMEYRDKVLGNESKKIPADPSHPMFDNIILNSLILEEGNNTKKVDNIYLGKIDKVYGQNLIIYGFNELREHLTGEKNPLYGKIVRLAVLQSGLTNSRIAFTTLLPYGDFKEVYNATLSKLEEMENLQDFKNLDVFERNNWNNRDIMPFVMGNMRPSKFGVGNYDLNTWKIGEQITKAVKNFQIPHIVNLDISSGDARGDFIVYSYDTWISKAKRILSKKTGDKSHVNKYLMKKVYTENAKGERVPLINISKDKEGREYHKYVFKAINAWGDSFKANELYDYPEVSKLDNDFRRVIQKNDAKHKRTGAPEVEDSVIVDLLTGKLTSDQLAASNRKTDLEAAGVTDVVPSAVEVLAESGPRHYVGEIIPAPDVIFVFGSNPEGRHGQGAAADAMKKFGAKYYQGRGLQGGAYALVTKNLKAGFKETKTGITYDAVGERSVRPDQIVNNIVEMYNVARANPNKKFQIGYRNTIGKTRNGYTGYEMMDMFKAAGEVPSNVYFSKEWVDTGKMDADYQSPNTPNIMDPSNKPTGKPGIDRTDDC